MDPEPVPYRRFETVCAALGQLRAHRRERASCCTARRPRSTAVARRPAISRAGRARGPAPRVPERLERMGGGCHLEPDQLYGRGYLEATRRALHGVGGTGAARAGIARAAGAAVGPARGWLNGSQKTKSDLLDKCHVRDLPESGIRDRDSALRHERPPVVPGSPLGLLDIGRDGVDPHLFARAGAVYKALSRGRAHIHHVAGRGPQRVPRRPGARRQRLISSRQRRTTMDRSKPGLHDDGLALADMFPGAIFIHVLRDGRVRCELDDPFRAIVRTTGRQEPLQAWATDFEVAAETWRHYVEFALDFCARNPDRAMTVKNEDLVERHRGGIRTDS